MSDETVLSDTVRTKVRKMNFDIQEVRISPERIIFDDPFEGKYFESELMLQNIGSTPKFIRILPPTSSNIRIKTAREGIFLPAGMSIKRKITYTVVMATLVKTFVIPIYINDQFVPYHCAVRIAKIVLQIKPQVVNFGLIDAGPITSKESIKIINNGHKPCRYSIDLGLNELNLQVEPLKGVVMEKGFVNVSLELNVAKEGSYHSEFWVVADSPIRVKVFVNVTTGILECIHDDAMRSFTFLKFPQIYYGTSSIKSIVMHNTSQLPSMFCVTGDANFKSMQWSDLKKVKTDYNNFVVSPLGGRLLANDKRPFIFTFAPKLNKNNKRYSLVLLTIQKIFCRDVGMVKYPEPLFRGNDETEGKDIFMGSISSVTSDGFILSSDFVDDENKDDEDVVPSIKALSNLITVILLGETEQASITIIPDEIYIDGPIMGQTTTRTLTLTNGSKTLPIYFKYKKVAFVNIEPKTGFLKPRESQEILVKITPESCTDVDEFVKFDLLYHDIPRMEDSLTVVGGVKIRVRFQAVFGSREAKRDFFTANTFPFDKPFCRPNGVTLRCLKKESAMLALPDDRPPNLRPWKDPRRCRTIYSAIPRPLEAVDDYMFSKSEAELRSGNKSYYNNYLRTARSANSREIEYSGSTTDIFEHIDDCCVPRKLKNRPDQIQANFLPLTPMELINIEINPRDAFIEGIVSRSNFTTQIGVTNRNEFTIRVYLRPQKTHSFHFPYGDRMVIGPMSTEAITYLYFTETSGIRTTMIDVIVNENHIFPASITVKVSPAILELDTADLVFEPDDLSYKCLEISNRLNAPIEFVWDFCGDFLVDPMECTVQPGKSVTSCIYFEAGKCSINSYELQLRMDNRRMKTVRVLINKINFNVLFTNVVDFEHVGRDIVKRVVHRLENKSVDDVPFKFNIDRLEAGIEITPRSGVIPRKGFVMISFTIKTAVLGDFRCDTVLTYARFFFKTVNIVGVVEFPKISFSPEVLRFRKMAASSFDIKCLTITNHSEVTAAITFDTEQYPEINYSEYIDSKFLQESDIINLPPKSHKVFSLHLYPFYSTATALHLPILINGLDHSIDKTCPAIKSYVASLKHRILIHTWQYNFNYFPYYKYESHTEERIAMQVTDYTKLCIRLDEAKAPFIFEHISGGTATKFPSSIVVELEPGQEAIFYLAFLPKAPGNYLMKLPVYVKDDLSEDMHNYFYVKGEYPLPVFEFNPNAVYFGFVPCNTPVWKRVDVKMRYHEPDCEVETFVDDFNVSVEIVRPKVGKRRKFFVKVHFSSQCTATVNTKIKFICSCGLTSKIKCIGGSDNCILTIYSYITYFENLCDVSPDSNAVKEIDSKSSFSASNNDATCQAIEQPPLEMSFPYFPTEDSAHTQYMNTLVTSVEKWMFMQIFHTSIYYKIPDTICVCDVAPARKQQNSGNKKAAPTSGTTYNMPIYNILKYYCGRNLDTVLSLNFTFDKNDYSPLWMFEYYESILDFMIQLGGMLPHVNPENLLEYSLYTDYMKLYKSDEEILTSQKFYLLSKQCWLDLILQTFKVLDYQRITADRSKSSCNLRKSLICNIQSDMDMNRSQSQLNHNIYSHNCGLYLAWLNKPYNDQKGRLCSSEFVLKSDIEDIKDRCVQNFTNDLSDCLAFCAVTLKYCPYVSHYFKGIYVPPVTKVETLHNASVLIKVWEMLDISFKLTPHELIEKNPVLMQLFIAYLYEFLSHLMPMDTIHFYADLGKKSSDFIVVINDNDTTINFNLKIFNDPDGVFSTDSSVTLTPGSTYNLIVHYHAKFVKKHTATLVLNGETYASNFFTNSKVYTLVGEPQLGDPILTHVMHSAVYEDKEFSIEVQSPFESEAVYELYLTSVKPTSLEELDVFPYAQFFKNRLLTRAYLEDFQYISSPTGSFVVNGMGCPITNEVITYWCFFKSDIGDFYIVISCITTPNHKDVMPLYVNIGDDVMKSACTCRHQVPDIENAGCPKNVRMSIPAINSALWKRVIRLYTREADVKEMIFWEKNQDNGVGPVLLRTILEARKQWVAPTMAYIFKDNIKYNILTKDFAHVRSITIGRNVCTVDTTIHLNSKSKILSLVMQSEDDLETRRYKIFLS